MTFEEIFSPPFHIYPDGYEIYIWCKGGKMAYNLLRSGIGQRICDLLNGDNAQPFNDIHISDDHKYILLGYSPILLIRGWGRLTGSLRLDPSEAVKIQNEFVEWTAKKLQGKS